jgi:DNA-directed RNA polymerase specialized sigma24 family protein
MISDGIENCLQYIDKFDPEKSKNPFAYFTQIIYYAFIRRITKEKKQQSIKEKLLKETNIEARIAVQAHDDERDYQQAFVEMLDKYTFHEDN